MNIHRHPQTRNQKIRRLAIALAALGLIAGATACSSDSSSSGASSADRLPSLSSQLDERGELPADEPSARPTEAAPDQDEGSAGSSDDSAAPERNQSPPNERRRTAPSERSVIQTGNVSLASDDVGATRFDAKQLVDQHSGDISEEETGTSDGEVSRVRMEIRVPADSFDELMTALSDLGELRSATRSAEDVSTQVIDARTRLKSQERSIARIQSLLASAKDLNQIISIESQLATRQADLESQKAQLAWLEDQSSLSTITLSLAPTEEVAEAEEKDDESGFLAGFSRGWDGLVDVATSLATGIGTALPFSVVLAVILGAFWALLRRRPARQERPTDQMPA